jgi:hypothetical protein
MGTVELAWAPSRSQECDNRMSMPLFARYPVRLIEDRESEVRPRCNRAVTSCVVAHPIQDLHAVNVIAYSGLRANVNGDRCRFVTNDETSRSCSSTEVGLLRVEEERLVPVANGGAAFSGDQQSGTQGPVDICRSQVLAFASHILRQSRQVRARQAQCTQQGRFTAQRSMQSAVFVADLRSDDADVAADVGDGAGAVEHNGRCTGHESNIGIENQRGTGWASCCAPAVDACGIAVVRRADDDTVAALVDQFGCSVGGVVVDDHDVRRERTNCQWQRVEQRFDDVTAVVGDDHNGKVDVHENVTVAFGSRAMNEDSTA